MPEQITKYPDVTLKVLKGAGAQCGVGAKQTILTKCPREQFCSLPTGEMCIYGLDQIPQMTQVSVKEVADLYCRPSPQASFAAESVPLLAAVLIAGLLLGVLLGRRRGRRPTRRGRPAATE